MKRIGFLLGLLLCCGLVQGTSMTGGRFGLVGNFTSGAALLEGGNYGLLGVVDYATAAESTDQTYQVFNAIFNERLDSPDITLSIEMLPQGLVQLSWPAEVKGYVLEGIPSLDSNQIWQPVSSASTGSTPVFPTENRRVISIDGAFRFYRLRK